MIVVGMQFYETADAAAAVRQRRARDAIAALDGVIPVNLQFEDEPFHVDGIRTLAVLRRDARTVTGFSGARKPIVAELFDALAAAAREAGCRYFVYANADIELTQTAVDWIVDGNRDGYAFCRVDRDPATDARLGIEVHGTDMFAVDWRWWTRERRRFRPYIAGELRWDNVYTAVMCTHGRGDIVDRRDLIFHQQHPVRWDDRSPYARYNGYLGALDARYFSRWVQYVYAAQTAPPSSDAEHDRLIQQTFALRPLSTIERAIDVARYVRATVKYRWQTLTRASRSD